MQVQKPDYQNSILNLVNSILHNYGAPHRYTTLPEADEILKKDYRHVVLLVLDGMGVSVLERFLPEESFLRSHFQKEISSVFPPTTVAATTTLESGLARMAWVEHVFSGNPGQGQCISQYDRKWRSDRRRIAG